MDSARSMFFKAEKDLCGEEIKGHIHMFLV